MLDGWREILWLVSVRYLALLDDTILSVMSMMLLLDELVVHGRCLLDALDVWCWRLLFVALY